ncbi:MAG TPA: DegT/DnrJ/EryC1/StrS family aminotransferase, partial [Nitrospirales bacterium]|nr:DegT/DnrJ/EryC1/StrS family aminotransferase [Nitrospirales bacterium]
LSMHSFNYKMTDVQAAIGLSQLDRFAGFLKRRAAIAACYAEALKGLPVSLPSAPYGGTHIFFRFILRPKAGSRPLADGVDDLLRRLEARGVQCRRPVYEPLHRLAKQSGCPTADAVHQDAVSVPIYPSLTDAEVTRVIDALRAEFRA